MESPPACWVVCEPPSRPDARNAMWPVQVVGGSNPVAPTIMLRHSYDFRQQANHAPLARVASDDGPGQENGRGPSEERQCLQGIQMIGSTELNQGQMARPAFRGAPVVRGSGSREEKAATRP